MDESLDFNLLTNRGWHRSVIGDEDVILCHRSALEHLQLFVGYLHRLEVEVYALKKGENKNIDYRLVDSFEDIDFIEIGGLRCTTPSQTFNDMMDDFDNADGQAFIEGLADYYFQNGDSFDGLIIKPENMELFDSRKEWAAEFYDEG